MNRVDKKMAVLGTLNEFLYLLETKQFDRALFLYRGIRCFYKEIGKLVDLFETPHLKSINDALIVFSKLSAERDCLIDSLVTQGGWKMMEDHDTSDNPITENDVISAHNKIYEELHENGEHKHE